MENAHIRTGIEPTFFGKVMAFFALAMLSSAAGAFITYTYFIQYFIQMPALMWAFFIVELAIIFTSRMWSQKIPLNRFMFATFAFITGITIAPLLAVVAASPGGAVMISKALMATGLMFSATALIGWTTKVDLSGMRGFLMIGLIGLIVVGIMGFFIPWSNKMEMVYSGIGVLIFSGFTMYDFQKIKKYPQDRYIEAALSLYLDIFNLFLFILRFMNARD
ncbi:MAG: Bax inhibitor-1/YccA family protein [bacterium]|nr:Bax inhibitor-1/YccA family protein [bacterium]